MSGLHWSKFFWSDWETDPALRLCSFAAQGLWMRMLCVAASHDPIGYVAVAGKGLDIPGLARVIGGAESEIASLLGELDRNGVFSRDRQQRIYSRRMVRDARKMAEARKFGAKGGNPKLSSGYDKPGFVYVVGPRIDGAYKIGISINPMKRLRKISVQYPGQNLKVVATWAVENMGASEAHVHSSLSCRRSGEWFFIDPVGIGKISEILGPLKGTQKAPSSLLASTPSSTLFSEDEEVEATRESAWPRGAFDQFWSRYPHKVGKRDAVKAFDGARGRVGFTELMAGLDRYVAKTDDRPWCNPGTFLRQDRWSDQPAISRGTNNGNGHRAGGFARSRVARFREQSHRSDHGTG